MKLALILAAAAEEHHDPSKTHHWLLPEDYELIWGVPASIIIFGLLIWKAGPLIKKAFNDRTARIQAQLDEAAADQAAAEANAADVRRALGDIEAERATAMADAEAQAEALLRDGQARLAAEVADLEAKAEADNATLVSRGMDELRSEIARLSAAAAEHVVNGQLTEDVHRDLIEGFIQKVGATQGASR
jgi:F-type H+-transporting ATPase subunit b